MNVPDYCRCCELATPSSAAPRARLNVRRVVLGMGTALVIFAFWRLTGGNYYMCAGAAPFVYSALSTWIAD